MSRTLEVGRLTLGVACAGSQRPYRSWTAPFTARNRPANSSSLTTLGGAARGYGGPPGGAVSCDASASVMRTQGQGALAPQPVGPSGQLGKE